MRAMANLPLRIATGNYDRVSALLDGTVRPEGIDLDQQVLFPNEIFRRMLEDRAFDACEIGLTYYLRTLDLDDPPFIAIPVFPIRLFRHASIFVNANSGIETPKDLEGRRIGEVFCYGHDAGIWARGILADDYGVNFDDVKYTVGGVPHPLPHWDWLPNNPPPHVDVQQLPADQTLGPCLEAGEIDALFSALVPPSLLEGSANVRRLFEDFETVERAYFERTGIFPIMHTFIMRRDVYQENPWIARSLYDAFLAAKDHAAERYRSHDRHMHSYFMIPWLTSLRIANRELMGDDLWPYGLAANRAVLDTFLRYHFEQGLSRTRLTPEALFAPETLSL
jgi:4,5-dihydroxyphthalate decarboxylase